MGPAETTARGSRAIRARRGQTRSKLAARPLPAADAHRLQAPSGIATLELSTQGGEDPAARRPDGMAQGDTRAVGVDVPRTTSWIRDASSPFRVTSSRITVAASASTGTSLKTPLNRSAGVRRGEQVTASGTGVLSGRGARRAAGSSVDGNEIRADRLGGGQ